MKTYAYIISFLLAVPSLAGASGYAAFQSRAMLGVNGVLSVREEFIYDFGEEWKHGVIREIPTIGPDNAIISADNVQVFGKEGAPIENKVSAGGNIARVQIGSVDNFVNGTQYYGISYALTGGARKEAMVWDVLPPIKEGVSKFRAELYLPKKTSINDITAECIRFSPSGNPGECTLVPIGDGSVVAGYRVDLENLSGDSIRLALRYSSGYIVMPSFFTKKVILLLSVIGAFSLVLIFIILFRKRREAIKKILFKIFGKKSDPEHFSYISRSLAERGLVDAPAVIAAIVDLSNRGYLSLDPRPLPAGLGEFIDYSVSVASEDVPPGVDGILIDGLGGGVDSLAQWIRDSFPQHLEALASAAGEEINGRQLARSADVTPTLQGFKY